MRLDGVDVRDIESSELRRHVVTVTQEPFLFSDTLRANVAFGVDDGGAEAAWEVGPGAGGDAGPRGERNSVRDSAGAATGSGTEAEGQEPAREMAAQGEPDPVDALVERAAADAALGPDLARMPAGIRTVVGERGITLSGGQKQRVALARAMLKPCDLLILDDVLSAVDHDTERLLVERIHSLTTARSILVVSHRISVLERADRVVVLERGRVTDEGHHLDLAARDGPYPRGVAAADERGGVAVMRRLALLARLPSQWRRFIRGGNAAAVIDAMRPHFSRRLPDGASSRSSPCFRCRRGWRPWCRT